MLLILICFSAYAQEYNLADLNKCAEELLCDSDGNLFNGIVKENIETSNIIKTPYKDGKNTVLKKDTIKMELYGMNSYIKMGKVMGLQKAIMKKTDC